MKKVPLQIKKYRTIFRAAVLCAVLSGLLFSCSEGIHLFPFPFTENSTANDAFESPEIAYQMYAPRFDNLNRANHKTESQPNYFPHFLTGNSVLFKSFSAHLVSEQQTKISPARKILKLSECSASGESRAPPLAV